MSVQIFDKQGEDTGTDEEQQVEEREVIEVESLDHTDQD